MNAKTRKLLRLCKEAGYRRVCIGVAHRSVPHSKTFLWPENAIFAWPQVPMINGWPALWRILDDCGISSGCGNRHQHNIIVGLVDEGAYYLNKKGEWVKKSDPPQAG